MIIGNGLMARAFKSYESNNEFLVFASGVSNSKSTIKEDFEREESLLLTQIEMHPEKHFVYFSTCSIDDESLRNMPYIKHKRQMEKIIKKAVKNYNIFRLSNIAGISNNPNTVLNFFHNKILKKSEFELWLGSERNIIDVDDAYKIIDHILQHKLYLNEIINIANTNNYSVSYIVKCMEEFLDIPANFTIQHMGNKLNINVSEITLLCGLLNIEFKDDYLNNLFGKYY